MEEKKCQTTEYGTLTSVSWNFDGIKMGHSVSRFNGLTSFSAHNSNEVVRLHYGLKGNYSFSCKQLDRSFDLIGSHHNIMFTEGFDMEVRNKTTELETFGIQFPKELFIRFTENADDPLRRFTENIMNGKNALLSEHWSAIDPGIQQVIQQIIHCRFSGDIKRLFLLSKSLELLALSAVSYKNALHRKDMFLKSSTDKEKIIAVRDLVIARVHCPPSLSDIAQEVGLNEYKLKRGFKEMFNTTVFGYLTEERMNLAYRYLLDTEKTAAEIATELGYATPQHFNTAFKKKFGKTPNSVRNNP